MKGLLLALSLLVPASTPWGPRPGGEPTSHQHSWGGNDCKGWYSVGKGCLERICAKTCTDSGCRTTTTWPEHSPPGCDD